MTERRAVSSAPRALKGLTRRAALGGLAMALTGCGLLASANAPTITPYPFVTASPRPAATLPPATATMLPSPTLTLPPPAPTLRGSPAAPTIGPQDSPTPPPSATVPGVEGECPVPPMGGFRTIYESDPGLPPAIGCPLSPREDELPQSWIVETRWQPFERGEMLWSSALGWDLNSPVVYVLYDDGTYQRFEDTYDAAYDPPVGELPPPAGLFEPSESLGKVWREGPGVSARLGWASGQVSAERTFMQVFTNGEMVYVVPVGRTYVFKHGTPNTWLTFDTSY